MKIKYLFLYFIFLGAEIFGVEKLLKVKIENKKIKKDGQITEQSVGKETFKYLQEFNKAVKGFRNAKTDYQVMAFADNMKIVLDSLVKHYGALRLVGSSLVYPYLVGKTIDGNVTNLTTALAELKEMPNLNVGIEKTFSCAAVFFYILNKLINEKILTKNMNCPSGNGSSSLGCIFLAKDSRGGGVSALDVAVLSGNFLFVYLAHLFASGVSVIEIGKNFNFDSTGFIKEKKFNDEVVRRLVPEGGKYKTEFNQALDNFKFRTKKG